MAERVPLPLPVGWYCARQYAQDIPIWENKRYLPKPQLCDGDGPILELRRYFEQFYPR